MENARSSPDPLALGQRYLEIDSIDRDIAVQEADTRAKVAAQLTARQIGLLQQISAAIADEPLLTDAVCGYLADYFFTVPTAAVRTADRAAFIPTATFLLYDPTYIGSNCSTAYPTSIRIFLGLTDAQISGILTLESGYTVFRTQKQNRTADVQVELRDELAKSVLDPLALGVRYVELSEISQELAAADKTARASARALLTPLQQSKLQALVDESSLTGYSYLAQTCHLFTGPAGTLQSTFFYSSGLCRLN